MSTARCNSDYLWAAVHHKLMPPSYIIKRFIYLSRYIFGILYCSAVLTQRKATGLYLTYSKAYTRYRLLWWIIFSVSLKVAFDNENPHAKCKFSVRIVFIRKYWLTKLALVLVNLSLIWYIDKIIVVVQEYLYGFCSGKLITGCLSIIISIQNVCT